MIIRSQMPAKGTQRKARKRIVTSFYTVLLFKTFQILLPFRQVLFRFEHFLWLVV